MTQRVSMPINCISSNKGVIGRTVLYCLDLPAQWLHSEKIRMHAFLDANAIFWIVCSGI